MVTSTVGYDRDLFVLPFDHRGSFEAGLLGIRGREASREEVARLAVFKQIIYEGFLDALESGVPKHAAAILVDQKYGESILADANSRGVTTCVPVEKSGQAEFDFEYGEHFHRRLQEASPTFAKVLVRYNPDGDADTNERQRRRLKILSDYTRSAGYKFIFELLVPATEGQLESVGGDVRAYDLRVRPDLTVRAIAEQQEDGIEPNVWKLEGTEDAEATRLIASRCRADGRDRVGVIVLGRGENEERVRQWLTVGAQADGVIGFAVGRTVFWQPLMDHKAGAISRASATSRISGAYQAFYHVFAGARARVKATGSLEGDG